MGWDYSYMIFAEWTCEGSLKFVKRVGADGDSDRYQ